MRLTYVDMYLSKEYHIKTDKIRCSQKLLLEAQKPNSWGKTPTKRSTILFDLFCPKPCLLVLQTEKLVPNWHKIGQNVP